MWLQHAALSPKLPEDNCVHTRAFSCILQRSAHPAALASRLLYPSTTRTLCAQVHELHQPPQPATGTDAFEIEESPFNCFLCSCLPRSTDHVCHVSSRNVGSKLSPPCHRLSNSFNMITHSMNRNAPCAMFILDASRQYAERNNGVSIAASQGVFISRHSLDVLTTYTSACLSMRTCESRTAYCCLD